eukprot:TRINITY_DN1180_c0_g1_i10.p8 TRINITY_DN1180_c0_g1~~TRINITY_DN1180_c0_g1_i10.p8  ORF type:complete len:152 (-),score=25.82 TRINITY_DN1180_c0_g1_i10:49-504(-)
MIYYTEAENIAAKIGDNYLIAKAANGLGLVYTEMYDYKRALEYYEKSIRIFEKLADKAYTYDYCSTLMNIGVCYMYKGDYNKAILYQNKALDKANQLHNMEMICKSYGNLGTIEQEPVSYTHLRAHETRHDLVCRLLLEKKKKKKNIKVNK